MPVGIMTIHDLFDVKYKSLSLLDFRMEDLNKMVMTDLAAHNTLVEQMMGELCTTTTERYMPYGSGLSGQKMRRVNEFARVETRRPPTVTGDVGFPLWKFATAIGWTKDWFQMHSAYDLAKLLTDVKQAHVLTIKDAIRWALYTPTNATVQDIWKDELNLTVRRLLNGDSQPIPTTPTGKTFNGASHSHYMRAATLDDTSLTALHDNVREHEPPGGLIIAINAADEDTVRGLSKFKPFVDSRVVQSPSTQEVYGPNRFDANQVNNQAIGVYKSATVWTKQWAESGAPVCYAPGAPNKPLAWRRQPSAVLQGLRLAASFDIYPLYAELMEDYFGIAVYQREAAAVLQIGAGGVYVDPAISIDIN